MTSGVHRAERGSKRGHGRGGTAGRPGRTDGPILVPSGLRETAGPRSWRAWAALVVASSAAPLGSGCARQDRAAQTDAARPIEIVVAAEPATLDPRFATDAIAMRVTRLVHAGLVRLDPDTLRPLPYLARAWRFRDAETLEVELRDDVRFHEGQLLGPGDVCATLEALLDPRLGSPHRAVVQALRSCKPNGAHGVILRVHAPRASLLTDLEVPILRADQAWGSARPKGDLDGLGPFRVARTEPGETELAPADAGALPTPRHRVIVRTMRDENARAVRLLAGRADIAPNAVSPLLWDVLARNGDEVHARPGANVTYMLLQNERPPFDRVAIRQALSSALDRGLVTSRLFAGAAQPAETLFPPGTLAHPAGLPPLVFDPDGARRALEEVARPLTLLTSTDRFRTLVARIIAQDLGDVGVRVEVVPLDFGVLIQRLSAGDFDMATLQMPELTEPNLLRWFFHSSSIPSAEHPTAGANRARFRDPSVDGWLDEAASELDLRQREELYGRVATRLRDQLPVIPLWHEDQVAVVSERAREFTLSAEGRWLSVATLP